MIREIDLFGVYLSPMLGFVVVAALAWLVLRRVLERLGAYRWVWHRPLFDAALFVILLAGLISLGLGPWEGPP
jgi:hypothetical protein